MKKEPILVILAAGMGSRYGGLKQIDPIGPNGEIILELSIFDAIKAGFKRFVFIIKEEIAEDFKSILVSKLPSDIEIQYVFQSIDRKLPEGYATARTKPWGTAHALLCCEGVIDAPFGVINADDFYGYESYDKLYQFLISGKDYAIISYILKNTLTEYGSVARGVCETENNRLVGVVERTKIQRIDGVVSYFENDEWHPLDENSPVSMNMWGLPVSFIDYLRVGFNEFLNQLSNDDVKSEYYIPSAIDMLMKQSGIVVENIVSNAQWFGVTYQEDKPSVKAGIKKLMDSGVYPSPLWRK